LLPLNHSSEDRHLDRWQEILKYIGTSASGIEVAPWFKPIIPRGGGRQVVVLDLFDRSTLIDRAESDPNIDKAMIPQIGEVDLVGSACEIAELVCARYGPDARFDFVVSSHNLEHLPDPVRFLQGCEALLVPGGIVAMAVPDKRACFDFFRPHTSTGEMLEAFHERRARPSLAQTFSQGAYNATLRMNDRASGAFTLDDNPFQIDLRGDVVRQYAHWLERSGANDTEYRDTHCWTFVPSSLELILTELNLLGLINFDIVSIGRPIGCEFYVHLRKRPRNVATPAGLADRRESLLQQVADELAYASRYAWALRAPVAAPSRSLFMIHIPKTAGETINHVMTEMLGDEHVRTHVESTRGFLRTLPSISPELRYISGHHRLPDVLANIDRQKWFVFVTLRNPVEHLISHLRWVKSLGGPDRAPVRKLHETIIQEMAKRLWEIDLNDIETIHRFVNEEFNDAKRLFDNCQVRYLLSDRNRLVNHTDAVEAVEALGNFDYVGFVDRLPETCAAIARAVGKTIDLTVIPTINRSPPHDTSVNFMDPAILDYYRKAVRWDAHLYTAAKNWRQIDDSQAA
jgi:SAM-dependent methyltransferase